MIYLCDVLNIQLNDAQKYDMIEEIGQAGIMTIADFKVFLDRMKKHKFYRRDYQELLVEFWKYVDERLERAYEMNHRCYEDDAPRVGEMLHLRDVEVFKINQNIKK